MAGMCIHCCIISNCPASSVSKGSEANDHVPFEILLCIYTFIQINKEIYINICMLCPHRAQTMTVTPCLSGHYRSAGLIVSLALAQPGVSSICSKDGGLSM